MQTGLQDTTQQHKQVLVEPVLSMNEISNEMSIRDMRYVPKAAEWEMGWVKGGLVNHTV